MLAEAALSRPARGRRGRQCTGQEARSAQPSLSVTWGNSQRGRGREAYQGFGDIWL